MTEKERAPRLDVTGTALRRTARSLGWVEGKTAPTAPGSQPVIALTTAAPPAQLVADLARLVEAGAAADWWLRRLSVVRVAPEHVQVAVAFSGGRRIAMSRTTVAASARRRAAGGRLGRPPSIGPELLDRIAAAKSAGRSFRDIAADLEASGVPKPGGARQWYASTVRAAYLRRRAAD